MIAILVGWIGAALGITNAVIRWIGTVRSPTVTGVSAGWNLLHLASNTAWIIYGLTTPAPPRVAASAVQLSMGAYVGWRLTDRRHPWTVAATITALFTGWITIAAFTGPATAGWAAGALGCVSVLPQIVKTWRHRDPSGIVPWGWALSAGTGAAFAVYGAVFDLTALTVTNLLYTAQILVLLAGWWRCRNNTPTVLVDVPRPTNSQPPSRRCWWGRVPADITLMSTDTSTPRASRVSSGTLAWIAFQDGALHADDTIVTSDNADLIHLAVAVVDFHDDWADGFSRSACGTVGPATRLDTSGTGTVATCTRCLAHARGITPAHESGPDSNGSGAA